MPSNTKKESNLIRVRNNQRRSRARRREYVAELERKLRECNPQGLPSCASNDVPSLQENILLLEKENRKLRELLAFAGVEQASVDIHLRAEDDGVPWAADSASHLQSSPKTSQGILPATLKPNADEASIPDGSDDMLVQSYLELPADEYDMMFDPLQLMSSFDPSPIPQSLSAPSLCDSSESAQNVNLLGPTEALLPTCSELGSGTTLCSVAYELVRENNKKGIDMIEIGIRLWNGFIKGEGDAACKVDNDLLSSVLEYIKG